MKKLSILFLLTFIVISATFGQSQRNDYKKIDYISVDEAHIQQFLELAQNELKNSFSSLIASGKVTQWCLYRVQYPGGKKSDYNFVSVALAPSLNVFQQAFANTNSLAFIPAETGEPITQHLNNVSTLHKSELWKIENRLAAGDTTTTPTPYMTMDYMMVPPAKNYDYLMLEDEIAKPLHQERMEQDRMEAWEVNSLILPGGTNYGYNYATSNYFDELDHIEFGFSDEIIKQAMGENSDIPELFNTIYTTRDLVSSELWKLITHTD